MIHIRLLLMKIRHKITLLVESIFPKSSIVKNDEYWAFFRKVSMYLFRVSFVKEV